MESRKGVILQHSNWASDMPRILHKSWFSNVKFPDQVSDNWFVKKAYAQRRQAEVVTFD